MSKFFIPMPLTPVDLDREAYGYNPYVPCYSEHYRNRATVECVGFIKNNRFVPSVPTGHDYYITKVHVVTKAGEVIMCSYPYNKYVYAEVGTIYVGCDCNIISYGISICKEKARPWIEKKAPAV